MSKKWITAAAIGCAVCVVLVLRNRQESEERPRMWDKMRQFMDDMPEDFPPRIMFDNLAAARENTERILAILEHKEGAARSEEEAGEE